MSEISDGVFLQGEAVALRRLEPEDATDTYLGWLNDPEVLRWRGRKAFPTTRAQLKSWIEGLPSSGDLVLAVITLEDGRHVGNIALNTILWTHGTAELSIMIGAKQAWSKGTGTQAISLVTAHAFTAMGLRRLWSESPNPAFNRTMEKLGWTHEGTKREAFMCDMKYFDIQCWGLLSAEWKAKGSQAR